MGSCAEEHVYDKAMAACMASPSDPPQARRHGACAIKSQAPSLTPNTIPVLLAVPDWGLHALCCRRTMGVVMQGPGTAHISYADPATAQRAVQLTMSSFPAPNIA
eukprot:scaffold107379_cov23-Tisochrysis_lutea.AAC.1